MTIKHTPGPWRAKSVESLMEIRQVGAGKIIAFTEGCYLSEEEEANAELIALAPTAPHECNDPECPGNKNRLKLEFFDQMIKVFPYALPDCQLTDIMRGYLAKAEGAKETK